MKAVRISGTENYAEEAPELLKPYESISISAQAPGVTRRVSWATRCSAVEPP